MQIMIDGSQIYFDVRVGSREAIVLMDGGVWYLKEAPDYGTKFLAQGRVAFPTVVARALESLGANN